MPAFHAPLPSVATLVRRYTEKLPELGEKLGERLLGGRYGVLDAKKLAHYALIASEVEKPDTLKQLRYDDRVWQATAARRAVRAPRRQGRGRDLRHRRLIRGKAARNVDSSVGPRSDQQEKPHVQNPSVRSP